MASIGKERVGTCQFKAELLLKVFMHSFQFRRVSLPILEFFLTEFLFLLYGIKMISFLNASYAEKGRIAK